MDDTRNATTVPADEERRPTRAKPTIGRRALRIVRNIILIYLAYCLLVFVFQRWVIFPDWIAPEPLPIEKYDASTTVMTRDIEDGKIIAWFIPAPGASAENPKPLVVFLHGNAEIIDTQDERVAGHLANGCSVLLPEYRGYGRSDGQPSEAALVDDAAYFLDLAMKRPEVDAHRIVIHGRSMGGGIAAQLAVRRKPGVLILGSTFTSMRTIGSRKAFVPGFLVRHPMDTAAVLRDLDVPVLIFHGTNDNIVNVEYGRELHAIARNSRYVELNCKHNDFPGEEGERYWAEIRLFLEENDVLTPLRPRTGAMQPMSNDGPREP